MSIEEAKAILNEIVITEPSIKSYNYVSAEEINLAIEKIMLEIDKKEQEIKSLRELKRKTKFYSGKLSEIKCMI